MRLPPVLFQTAAGIEAGIEDIIRGNSRTPDVVIGDLRGQVGATRLGAARLAALCEEYGDDIVLEVMERILVLTERRLGGELSRWPDGVAEAEGFLDDDGADKDRPVRIAVKATKTGDRLHLDFSGCAAQTARSRQRQSMDGEVGLVAGGPGGDRSDHPDQFRAWRGAVEFRSARGLAVNPRFPATINLYFPTAVMIYSCVLSALGKLNPARAVAPSGLVTGAVAFGYRAFGKPLVQYEIGATGLGGTSGHDGTAMVTPMNHFTAGAPVEMVETEYPMMVRRYDIWRNSAGPADYRGGVGYVREFRGEGRLRVDAARLRPPLIRHGGWRAALGRRSRGRRSIPARPTRRRCRPIETRQLKAGDVLRLERSGGGGYGSPLERPVEAVRQDIDNGYVSAESARKLYGLLIREGLVDVDWFS